MPNLNLANVTMETRYLHDYPEFWVTICVGQSITSVIGFFINVIAIVILLRNHRPLSVQNQLVLNTLFCDVALTSYCLPRVVYLTYRRHDVPTDDVYCRIDGAIRYFVGCQYLMGLVYISYHRFVIILTPGGSKWRLKGRQPLAAIIGSIIFFFTVLIPPTVGVWGRIEYRFTSCACALAASGDVSTASYNYVSTIMAFCIPLVSMATFYGAVLRVISKQNKIMMKTKVLASDKKEERRKSEIYVFKMCLFLVTAYSITNLPRMATIIIESLYNSPMFHGISAVVHYWHAIYGPVFFVFCDKNVQRKLKLSWNSYRGKSSKIVPLD